MNDSTANRLNQLFAGSKSDPALNPLFNSYLMTGHELLNNRKVQEALEPLSRASALVPDNANAHYLLGRADLAIQRFGDAAFQFHKVLDLDPRHIPAWNNLGGALLQQGQPAEALAAFGKARELEPSNRTIRTNRAVALIRLPGHVDEGIAELQEVLRAEPGLTAAQDALKEGIEVKRKDAERTSASRAPEAAAKPAPAIAR
jgi:Flp pilus assembly protein TadD